MAQRRDPMTSEKLKALKDKTSEDPKYSVLDSLLFYENLLVVPDRELQNQLTISHHDTLPAGHSGYKRTLARLRELYWWPKMSKFVNNYVKSCFICQRSKHSTCKPQGLLCPLPIPEGPW